MSFRSVPIRNHYRSNDSNIVSDFLLPVLSESIEYKRAVGFFSSSALIRLSIGLLEIAKRKGSIKLIVSPKLTLQDATAIEKGYKSREQVIEEVILRDFESVFSEEDLDRLNLLSNLIAKGFLDIKVAVTVDSNHTGMYHEKIGIMKDNEKNTIAFTGSMNESESAFSHNFESIVVFNSWETPARTEDFDSFFDQLWDKDSKIDKLCVYDFPNALKRKLIEYKKTDIDFGGNQNPPVMPNPLPKPKQPPQLYDYQNEAINNWIKQNGRGIFDMATGSGKTYTALGAVRRLMDLNKGRLATVIVCPYLHLVEQWDEQAIKFGIHSILGYSQSEQRNWHDKLVGSVYDYNDMVIQSFTFITTTDTYRSKRVQKLLSRLKGNALLIADEAHRMGATRLQEMLLENFNFRLALSATVDRHNDDSGTERIYDYFGKKCIEYDLDRAIRENKLTPYKYYPIVTHLTSDELAEYIGLTRKIGSNMVKKNGKTIPNKYGELLLIKRAKIIAGAINKIHKLKQALEPYHNKHNMLIYCGTANINREHDYDEEIKQITHVCDVVGNEMDLKIEKYTSKESRSERKIIKDRFMHGDDLQALVAIKCLDEGIDIPSIKTAFILASSTNPREYIQRRGRVLRKSEGKEYAEIFDFITLPFSMDGFSIDRATIKTSKTMLLNELQRVKIFAKSSLNPSESEIIVDKIIDYFSLDEFELISDEKGWEV